MKNIIRLSEIIALVAVIGFSMSTCDLGNNDDAAGSGTTITIKNDTGIVMWYYWIKPSSSTDWGTAHNIYLTNGESKTFSVSKSISSNTLYDIRVSYYGSAWLYSYIKYNISLTNRTTLDFTSTDRNDGDKFPHITIQNRAGVNFDSCYIKPSSASDWGYDFGSLSNNNDETITIPIPLSNYSVFDIQMKKSGTTVIYSKQNITITDGMTIVILSTDSNSTNAELPVIVIQNDTGIVMWYYWIKPSSSADWGSAHNIYLDSGISQAFTLPQSLSANNIYDIRVSYYSSAWIYTYTKNNVSISDGMTLYFTNSDREN